MDFHKTLFFGNMMSSVDTHQFPVLNFPRTGNANSLQGKEITRGRENTKWDKPAKSRFSPTAEMLGAMLSLKWLH
jgi:hypothetical protein